MKNPKKIFSPDDSFHFFLVRYLMRVKNEKRQKYSSAFETK
jgi:hypothetical protein